MASSRVSVPGGRRGHDVGLAGRRAAARRGRRPGPRSSRATSPSPSRRPACRRGRRRRARRRRASRGPAPGSARPRRPAHRRRAPRPTPRPRWRCRRCSPSGVDMSVSRATVCTPASWPERDHRRGQLAGVVDGLHEGTGADLHVEDQRAGALGDLLAHDRRRDQRDRLARCRSRRAGRRASCRPGASPSPAAQIDRPDRLELGEHLVVGHGRPASRGSTRACRGCRRCGRARVRDSCGTATPHAATSGASGSVILSPTPPVECLSAVGRDSEEKSIRSPDAIIASVHRRSRGGSSR